MPTTSQKSPIELSVAVQATPERVVVSFRVGNRHQQPIYLFDRAYKAGPDGYVARPDHLLVRHEPPDRFLLATKLLPFPPGIAFATPPTALGTLVAPGASYKGQGSARLPLRPDAARPRWDESGRERVDHLKEVAVKYVQFELGFVLDATELQAQPIPGLDGPVYQLSAAAWRMQQLVMSPALKVELQSLILR